MESVKIENAKHVSKIKAKPGGTDSLRVSRETKKKVLSELSALNKKDFGKPILAEHYISLAISLLQSEHLEKLRAQSLTAQDRFEQKYKEHCSLNGKISKDDYLGILLKE